MTTEALLTEWFSTATPPSQAGWYEINNANRQRLANEGGHADLRTVMRFYSKRGNVWLWRAYHGAPLTTAFVGYGDRWRGLRSRVRDMAPIGARDRKVDQDEGNGGLYGATFAALNLEA